MGDPAGRSLFGRDEDDGTGNKIVLGCRSNGHGRCSVRNGDLLFLAMTGHGDGPTIDAFDGEIANNVPGTEFVLCPGDWHLFADNALASYDGEAAALLGTRVLEFLGRV